MIFVSSDHHANFEALEAQMSYCQDENLPFFINGDLIGDYNFENLASKMKLTQKSQLQDLNRVIIRTHAKKLALLIDRYQVHVYFQNGNHEPAHFGSIVTEYLQNSDLFVNLHEKPIVSINSLTIASVANVQALMSFLHDIYSSEELSQLYAHQLTQRPTLDSLKDTRIISGVESDFQWDIFSQTDELDVFLSHGQIGQGAWRDSKKCSEVPTLAIGAYLSQKAQLTVDGHLHTSHEMINDLGKMTIRGVGNVGYKIFKKNGLVCYEKVSFDAPYDARGGLQLQDLDVAELLASDLVW